MSTTTALMHTARSEMPGFQGRLTAAADPGYDEARKVYNAMIDRHPALIASCTDSSDVAKVVSFAGHHDLLLAVRGGAHNGAGLGTCDDGMVLDLSGLKGVKVDPGARTARVGGGCTWGEVDAATNKHGHQAGSSRPPASVVSHWVAALGT
jgi:FAD/FMN-containing dehydrogenase